MGSWGAVGIGWKRGLGRALGAALAAAALLGVTGCMGGDDDSSSTQAAAKYDGKPVTITLWTGFIGPRARRHQGDHRGLPEEEPEDHRRRSSAASTTTRSSPPPAAATRPTSRTRSPPTTPAPSARSGAWIDLSPYMERDGVSDEHFPQAVQSYTQFEGTRCALPMLADVYGLYYNKDMLAQGGHQGAAEDDLASSTADAKKLTAAQLRRHDRGRRLRAHLRLLRERRPPTTPRSGTRNGPTTDGKSTLASDPAWTEACSTGTRT